MVYFGCGSLLQFSEIILVGIATYCSFAAWYADVLWGFELERIKVIFTDQEARTLRRDGQFWEIPYLCVLLGLFGLSIVHTFLCFYKQKTRFHKSRISRLMTLVVGLGLIGNSVCPLITAAVYDANYSEVEKNDVRVYRYQGHFANGSTYEDSSNSIFYYCHFANGRPLEWSKLKGIRMKKYGSNICQEIGLRILSAFLTIYAGILYLLTLKVLDSRRRDKHAAHVALLFDLFGDLEESIVENASRKTHHKKHSKRGGGLGTVELDMGKYKRALLQSSFKNTKLPPKLEKWLETGKYEEEGDEALKRHPIPQPNEFAISPYEEENEERGVPDYLSQILQSRLKIKGGEEEKKKVALAKEEALEAKKKAWKMDQMIRAKGRKVRYDDRHR